MKNAVDTKRARELLRREVADSTRDVARLAEIAVERSAELRFALDSMRVAREEAARASEVKNAFLSLVSRELKTPLEAVEAHVGILGEVVALTPDAASHVHRIATAAARLGTVVDSLIEYARLESGRVRVRPEPTDLGGLLEGVVGDFRSRAQAKGLEVVFASATVLPLADTDPRLLRVVVANLVDNAVKFSQRGVVRVDLAFDAGEHQVRVSDAGVGISASSRAVLFEPFERFEQHGQTPGVGLGLAIVRHLARALGARLDLETRPGEGTTVLVAVRPNRVLESGTWPLEATGPRQDTARH